MARPRFPQARFQADAGVWPATVARKREVVLRLLRGEPMELMSRQFGVETGSSSRRKANRRDRGALKDRQGRSVFTSELDTRHRSVIISGMTDANLAELLQAKRREVKALWGNGGRGDECRHLGQWPPTGLRGVRPGITLPVPRSEALKSRSMVLSRAKRRGLDFLDLGRLCWWPSATWRHPREGEGHRKAQNPFAFGTAALTGAHGMGNHSVRSCCLAGRKSPDGGSSQSPKKVTQYVSRRRFTVDNGAG